MMDLAILICLSGDAFTSSCPVINLGIHIYALFSPHLFVTLLLEQSLFLLYKSPLYDI